MVPREICRRRRRRLSGILFDGISKPRKAVPATFTLMRVSRVNGDRVTKDTDMIEIIRMHAEDMHTRICLEMLYVQELKLSLKQQNSYYPWII